MASLAEISIRFTTNLKQLSSQLQNANRRLKKTGQQMQRTGTALTVGLTAPIVALGAKSVIAFDKQAKALAQVEAGIKSTGGAAKLTSKELQELAAALQQNSLFGDEQVLKDVTAQLLTFTNIAGDQFKRTQQATLDLATRLDGDLKSAAIQLGKALNDPVANLSALSRSGIQFSKDQKEAINSLVETNRLADAQTLILNELEKQYGGAAAAAAAAGLGPFKQLSNSLGDLLEDFGAIISEALIPFVDRIRKVADRLKELDPATKKTIVIIAALAAAIGPLLVSLGFMVSTILPALAAGFTAITGPIGLVIAGVAALAVAVYKNWDRILAAVQATRDYFQGLYKDVDLVRVTVNLLTNAFIKGYAVFKNTFGKLIDTFALFAKDFFNQVANAANLLKAVLEGDFKRAIAISNKAAFDVVENLSAVWDTLNADNSDTVDRITKGVKELASGLEGLGAAADVSLDGPKGGGGLRGLAREIQGLAGGGFKSAAAVMVASSGDIQRSLVSLAELVPNKLAPSLTLAEAKLIQVANTLNERIGPTIQQAAGVMAAGLGEVIASFALGADGFQSLANLILQTLGDLMIRLGEIAIQAGIGITAIEAAFKSINGALAVAAGIALVAFGNIIRSQISQAPGRARAFADGGIVYGPTLGLVGEYPGASRNPEVIAPLDKLRSLIEPAAGSSGAFIADTVIRGEDLLITFNRAQQRKNRVS